MDYHKAFIKLYGAAGAALDELVQMRIVTYELDNVIKILRGAMKEVEEMQESGEG